MKDTYFRVRCNSFEKKKLKILAEREGLTISDYLRDYIRRQNL